MAAALSSFDNINHCDVVFAKEVLDGGGSSNLLSAELNIGLGQCFLTLF
jgi:hypothetical protein